MRAFLDRPAVERISLENAFEELFEDVRSAFRRQIDWEKTAVEDGGGDGKLPTPSEMLASALERDVDSDLFPGFVEFLSALDREGFVISRRIPNLTSRKRSVKTRKPRIRILAEVEPCR